MTFPNTPIALTFEMFLNGAWTNITTDVQTRGRITITRGRGDQIGTASPAQCTFMLNNRAGKYSRFNPNGIYYGQLTLNTQVRVTVEGSLRFWGEISEWPPSWDMSTRDAWVQITANGILRRAGQGRVEVAGFKSFLLTTSPVTYWPCDDGSESDRAHPAAGTYQGSTIHREIGNAVFSMSAGTLASYLPPTLRINDTLPAAGYDRLIGYCRGSDSTPDALAMDLLWRVDTEVIPTGTLSAYPAGYLHFHLYTNGTGGGDDWDLLFRHDGTNDDITLQITDTSGTTSLGNTAALTAVQDTELHHLRLKLVQNGANVDYTLYVDGTSVLSGTHNTHTLVACDAVTIEYDRTSNTLDGLLNIGHVIVWENAANIPDITTTAGLAQGFIGEAAGRRFERLAGELDLPFVSIGDLDDTIPMGLQYTDDPMTQFTEIETTDGGMIYEPRDSLANGYRTRASLYNQSATLTLVMTSKQIAAPLEPTDDDRYLRNDILVQRREGASYQAVKLTGPLSVQSPPNGVGRYKDEVEVNCETDDLLPSLGGWFLLLGTVDKPRYPQVVVERAAPGIVASPTTSAAAMSIDVGDRLVITSTDALNIYDDISLIVIGYAEIIDTDSHRFTYTCVPEAPFEVMELDGVNSWLDPGTASTLSSSATSGATSISVATTGFLWSTSGSDYPEGIMVAGEEMTVTAVSGASSPQTFTVTRSVNGVVKAQASGAQVDLKRPGVIGL